MLACVVLGAALAFWAAQGANQGWTKTTVPVQRTDAVTGLTVDDYQKRFFPGVDFLGAALLVAGVLGGTSFLVGNHQPQTSS